MKIAVYTIALNESAHIARWAESAAEADVRLVLDTGSTDGTVKTAERAGCTVHTATFDPWRFDVARNLALDLLPDDVDWCITLDADEVLMPGWRQAIETVGVPEFTTRLRYRYVWSWQEDGSPGLVYAGDKVHTRHGYHWRLPVHETLCAPEGENGTWVDGLEIHHHPDPTKPRSDYLPLLEQAKAEAPLDDRTAHYLGREYMYAGRYEDAAAELQRHLALPTAQWTPERAASMRYLAEVTGEKERWLLRACAEDPGRRESWVALADHYYHSGMWHACMGAVEHALRISDQPLDYLCEPHAWGPHVYDIGAVAAYHAGDMYAALRLAEAALEAHPDDERLQGNLELIEAESR